VNHGRFSNREADFGAPPEIGPIVPRSARQTLRPEEAPQPPKRSKKARSQFVVFLNFLMTLAVLVLVVGGAAVYYGKIRFSEPGPLKNNTEFMVRKGAGVRQIADQLEQRGVISNALIFKIGVGTYMRDDTLKAGEYQIKAGSSMREVMDLLRSGKVIQHFVTVPEGLTVAQIFLRLSENTELSGDLPKTLPPEGSLRPETYHFARGTTRREILDQMAADQAELVDEEWSRRSEDLPIKTKEEFVTLASIVEKETGRADERTLVASVFLNRLRKGMRLQSDPTIIYGLFGGIGKPADRPIYQSDLSKKTPYNTYLINGLPPTPIANPGKAALEAVANPSKTDYLYFVADGSGGHVFSATLEEHNANVKRWRRIEAEKTKQEEKVDQ